MPVLDVTDVTHPRRRHGILVHRKGEAERRRKRLRLHGLHTKLHSRLLRRAATFTLVTIDARDDDVLPTREPTESTRDHVIVRRLHARNLLAAVLTRTVVAREHV